MNNILKIDKVLIYNDGPELFTTNDVVGTKYLCMRIDHESDTFRYISIAISDRLLLKFFTKQITLRRLFENPENGIWFLVVADGRKLVFAQILDESIITSYLPDPSIVYIEDNIERTTVRIPSKIDFVFHMNIDVQYPWPDDIHAYEQTHMRRRANEAIMYERA